jgi:poly(hydroxyalkanoate) granule-associated protein
MAEEKVMHRTTRRMRKRGSMAGMARRFYLASIGAAVMAQEQMDDLFGRLIEKGEDAEQDRRKMSKHFLDRYKKETATSEEDMDDRFEDIIDRTLNRMNIPTKSDLDALRERVNELSHKIEERQGG